jgi:hypothetical protein
VGAQHRAVAATGGQQLDQAVHVAVGAEVVDRLKVQVQRRRKRQQRLPAAQRRAGQQPLDPEVGKGIEEPFGLRPPADAERPLGIRAAPVALVAGVGVAYQ